MKMVYSAVNIMKGLGELMILVNLECDIFWFEGRLASLKICLSSPF